MWTTHIRMFGAIALWMGVHVTGVWGHTISPSGRYSLPVGEAGEITLEEFEEVEVDFTGAKAEYVAVSFLQCTGEKPQELKVKLALGEEYSENTGVHPGCLKLKRPSVDVPDEEEICVFPELGYGNITSVDLTADVLINPTNVVLTMSNEGNATTTVHLAMFSDVVQPEEPELVIYDEASPTARIENFYLSVEVNFGWNTLEFCVNNECVVEGYLLDYDPPMPHAYICLVESHGELIYTEGFQGGTNELEAAVDLPDDNPHIVTFILSQNATTNFTSPLLAVNQEIVYQTLVIDGDIEGYPAEGLGHAREKDEHAQENDEHAQENDEHAQERGGGMRNSRPSLAMLLVVSVTAIGMSR